MSGNIAIIVPGTRGLEVYPINSSWVGNRRHRHVFTGRGMSFGGNCERRHGWLTSRVELGRAHSPRPADPTTARQKPKPARSRLATTTPSQYLPTGWSENPTSPSGWEPPAVHTDAYKAIHDRTTITTTRYDILQFVKSRLLFAIWTYTTTWFGSTLHVIKRTSLQLVHRMRGNFYNSYMRGNFHTMHYSDTSSLKRG